MRYKLILVNLGIELTFKSLDMVDRFLYENDLTTDKKIIIDTSVYDDTHITLSKKCWKVYKQ